MAGRNAGRLAAADGHQDEELRRVSAEGMEADMNGVAGAGKGLRQANPTWWSSRQYWRTLVRKVGRIELREGGFGPTSLNGISRAARGWRGSPTRMGSRRHGTRTWIRGARGRSVGSGWGKRSEVSSRFCRLGRSQRESAIHRGATSPKDLFARSRVTTVTWRRARGRRSGLPAKAKGQGGAQAVTVVTAVCGGRVKTGIDWQLAKERNSFS